MSNKLAPILAAVAGLLFLFVAIRPSMNDRPMNTPYLVLAIVFFIPGFIVARRSGAIAPPRR